VLLREIQKSSTTLILHLDGIKMNKTTRLLTLKDAHKLIEDALVVNRKTKALSPKLKQAIIEHEKRVVREKD